MPPSYKDPRIGRSTNHGHSIRGNRTRTHPTVSDRVPFDSWQQGPNTPLDCFDSPRVQGGVRAPKLHTASDAHRAAVRRARDPFLREVDRTGQFPVGIDSEGVPSPRSDVDANPE